MSFLASQFLGSLFDSDEPDGAAIDVVADPVAVEDTEVEVAVSHDEYVDTEATPPVEIAAVSYAEQSDDVAVGDDLPDDVDLWPGDDTADPAPCSQCGSLELWETLADRWRCCKCDPPTKSRKWAEKAERLHNRYGLEPVGA
jgi:hypothetical protein